ncbi:acetate--CoA ligase family protein [Thermoplasmatales archaeon AK]|nr:acetate--CoA ligase family protein [Thermoplasmatales archaeon AK]
MNNSLSSLIARGNANEYTLKSLLRNYGFKVPNSVLISQAGISVDIRYPVALKVVDSRILHKTEMGAIKLGIRDQADLAREIALMKGKFQKSDLMVEEMQTDGLETIAGLYRDSTFGLCIMIGMGGIFSELYGDVTFRGVPINRVDAIEMVGETRISKFAGDGFRGLKANTDSLVSFLLRLSDFAADNEDCIQQLDLNPVLVKEHEEVILDAKIIGYSANKGLL